MIFKALSARFFFPLMINLLTLSIALSVTGFLVYGGFNTLSYSIGNEESLVISSSNSIIPQTGAIPLSIVKILEGLKGIDVISPEVLSLGIVKDNIIFLRGVLIEAFQSLEKPKLVSGDWNLNENEALIGIKAAKVTNTHIGEIILVKGIFTNKEAYLTIKGIFETRGALDDEIIIPLNLAQTFRGFSKSIVSIVRVKINNPSMKDELINILALKGIIQVSQNLVKSVEPSLPSSISTVISRSYTIGEPQQFAERLLRREIAFSSSTLWTLMLIVFASSFFSLYYAASWTFMKVEQTIMILRALGSSRRKILARMWLKFFMLYLPITFTGYILGYLIASLASQQGMLRILFHTIQPTLSLDIFLISSLTPLLLITIFISLYKFKP